LVCVLVEVAAADVIGVETRAVVDNVKAVDVDDVRMREGGDGLGFISQGFSQVRALGRRRRQLQRHLAIQRQVACPIDLAHAASAEKLEDLVFLPEPITGRQGPFGRSRSAGDRAVLQKRLEVGKRRPHPAGGGWGQALVGRHHAHLGRRLFPLRAVSEVPMDAVHQFFLPELTGADFQQFRRRSDRRPDRPFVGTQQMVECSDGSGEILAVHERLCRFESGQCGQDPFGIGADLGLGLRVVQHALRACAGVLEITLPQPCQSLIAIGDCLQPASLDLAQGRLGGGHRLASLGAEGVVGVLILVDPSCGFDRLLQTPLSAVLFRRM